MGRYLITFFIVLFLFSACAPKEFKPERPEFVEFDKQEHYKLDLSDIDKEKPSKLVTHYLDKDFNEVDKKDAAYILLAPKEYAKIPALLRLCKAYKDIIEKQTEIINNEIYKSNALKEYLILEQKKRDGYFELWVISENAYRQEKYYHDMDRYSNYFLFGTITIIALIIAL